MSCTRLESAVGVTILALSFAACAPTKSENKNAPVGYGGAGTGAAPNVTTGSVPNFGSSPNGTAGDPIFNPGSGSAPGEGPEKDEPDCGGVTARPEQRTIYIDATVTDTIITLKPIALYIMQDRSSSMVGVGVPNGDTSRWPNSMDAITRFVDDPNSVGLDVGIGFFPPMSATADQATQGNCATGADCGAPVVAIGPVTQTGGPIKQAMTAATPPTGFGQPIFFTPTTCAVLGMINECLRFQGASPTGEKCVAVLVTDGEPTLCMDGLPNSVVDPVAAAAQQGVATFAVALPGAQAGVPLLTQIATAGGTTLIDLTAGGSAQALLTALNSIREKVVDQTVTHHSTPQVIESKLACEWNIPERTPEQDPFDKEKVNMTFTMAGATQTFGHVTSAAGCDTVVNGDGWYYDNEEAPTQILACPHTCDTIKNSTSAEIQLKFGCKIIIADPR